MHVINRLLNCHLSQEKTVGRLTAFKQVAQLWQRDRAKLDTLSINVRYSQPHQIAFLGHPMGASGAIQALYMKVLLQKTL